MISSTLLIVAAAAVYQTRASFLQCSPSDSLEAFDALDGSEHGHAQLVNCDHWPFYSGGHPHSNGYSSSSSSSDDDSSDDADEGSLLPSTITSDSPLYGFDDGIETTQCLVVSDENNGICSKWTVTMQEYEDTHGCGGHYRDAEAQLLTSYKLCLCATFASHYCAEWACLDMPGYPTEVGSYSLIKDNQFVMDKVDISNPLIGDIWRFKTDNGMVEMAANMELKNCWCQTEDAEAGACDDWFCGTLEREQWKNEFGEFAVDGFGRFGCFDQGENATSTACANWYGFMYHGDDYKYHDRDEYRCQCVGVDGDDCLSSICGLKQIPVRKNWVWYIFPLAFLVWGCLCGCCGTKKCFRRRCGDNGSGDNDSESSKWMKPIQCRKSRMFLFFCVIGLIATYHGGLPALLCFGILFSCSLCGAVKREKCGGRCCGKRWAARMKANCEAKQLAMQQVHGTAKYVNVSQNAQDNETGLNGENSKAIGDATSAWNGKICECESECAG